MDELCPDWCPPPQVPLHFRGSAEPSLICGTVVSGGLAGNQHRSQASRHRSAYSASGFCASSLKYLAVMLVSERPIDVDSVVGSVICRREQCEIANVQRRIRGCYLRSSAD